MRSAFLNDLGQVRRKMPSATVLRLHEFTLDVALLLAERWTSFANRGAVVKYMLADSSPVAGFDWLWSMHYEIKKEDLIELFESVVRLSLATSQFCETLRDEAAEDGHGLPVEPRMTPAWVPSLGCPALLVCIKIPCPLRLFRMNGSIVRFPICGLLV